MMACHRSAALSTGTEGRWGCGRSGQDTPRRLCRRHEVAPTISKYGCNMETIGRFAIISPAKEGGLRRNRDHRLELGPPLRDERSEGRHVRRRRSINQEAAGERTEDVL